MRVARTRGSVSGFVLVLLGAWGALIPFIGPYANFGFGADKTWVWHIDRLWLNVLPGAAAVLGGLVLLGLAERVSLALAAWLAAAGGAWFVVGPVVSVLWNNDQPATGAPLGDTHRQVVEYLAFHYALGAVILFLGAVALGRMTITSVRDVETTKAVVARRRRPARWHRRAAVEEVPATTPAPRTRRTEADGAPRTATTAPDTTPLDERRSTNG